MRYRVCKVFEIESGHMLSKHPGRCRYPHGHSRRVEVVVASDRLDEHDMVCDFKALRLALEGFLDAWDHAMMVNAQDPALDALRGMSERVIALDGADPTTEIMARRIYEFLEGQIRSGKPVRAADGIEYTLPAHLEVERVRVGETSTSWAEFGRG